MDDDANNHDGCRDGPTIQAIERQLQVALNAMNNAGGLGAEGACEVNSKTIGPEKYAEPTEMQGNSYYEAESCVRRCTADQQHQVCHKHGQEETDVDFTRENLQFLKNQKGNDSK